MQLPDGRVILVDISPEFRLAAIRAGLPRVDAVLFTHAHADHIMGLDDIRRYNYVGGRPIPCYANARAKEIVERCFRYALAPVPMPERPAITVEIIDGPREICGVTVTPVPLRHGNLDVLGFRIGQFAYCTDCSEIPSASWPLLEGLDMLILDALRHRPHPTHFNFEQALAVAARLRPKRTLLTHLTHEISHAKDSAKLPPGVELAYDNQRLIAPL